MNILKKQDQIFAISLALLTLLFLFLMNSSNAFFDWAFARHQNQLSWFIRPIFLVPYCYFAYKRSWAGISLTVFAITTSMVWFPKPEVVSEQVIQFLQFEKDWIDTPWDISKILLVLAVPISSFLLGFSFWKRNLWMGIGVMVLMAFGKIIWSIQNAGESGKSIIIPAIIGLVLCIGFVLYGFKKLDKKK